MPPRHEWAEDEVAAVNVDQLEQNTLQAHRDSQPIHSDERFQTLLRELAAHAREMQRRAAFATEADLALATQQHERAEAAEADRDRETELRRASERHNKQLREALEAAPYPSDLVDLEDIKADRDRLQEIIRGGNCIRGGDGLSPCERYRNALERVAKEEVRDGEHENG